MALEVKNVLANAGDVTDAGSIPGSGRTPGEGNGNPLQHSCLEKPLDSGASRATVHGVAQSQTRPSTHGVLLSFREARLHCRWIPQGTGGGLWLLAASSKLTTCLSDCHASSPPFLLSCGLVTPREGVQNAMIVPLLTLIQE